ncbi:MAG: hypothetical protein EPN65_16645 [Pandoraea sp.]|uniref:transcriptional regulator n=1 Tax=Pandoraea sp. TaxID=1883445 RepID=UPI00120D9CB3|nr:YdaS family helix-turn-helix protein [Pandoraea sp.]TAM15942.1 MAG: hypothetical protein EPN65_16645 [Pandoraea sp.]
MDLKTYLSTLERGGASALATSIGVSISFLSQMASGSSAISPARCVSIERATGGAVTRRDLRPDDWADIWPELFTDDQSSKSTPEPQPSPQPVEGEAA